MSADRYNFSHYRLPRRWKDITDAQLRYALTLMADGRDGSELWVLCLMRWSRLTVQGRDLKGFRLQRHGRGRTYRLTHYELATQAMELSFLSELDKTDGRHLARLSDGTEAVDTWLHGVAYGDYLKMEIAYQGAMQSRKEKPLRRLCGLLYRDADGRATDGAEATQGEMLGAMIWYAAIKERLAKEFSRLFKPADTDGTDTPDMKAVTDMQLRLLTGGDVTKEPQVMAADTWRCLTELEAKATENQ